MSSRLVRQYFRKLVCSEQALLARVLIEEAYETCVGKNEAALEPLAMARGLEAAYERLSAELDRLPRQLVQVCEREGFRQELAAAREADDAAKKVSPLLAVCFGGRFTNELLAACSLKLRSVAKAWIEFRFCIFFSRMKFESRVVLA